MMIQRWVRILGLVLLSVVCIGMTHAGLDDQEASTTSHPTAGFELGNPPVMRIRAADGPLNLYVATTFTNWEKMPQVVYRFVATAAALDQAPEPTIIGPVTTLPKVHQAGVSTSDVGREVDSLALPLPPGRWTVKVSMHDFGSSDRSVRDAELLPLHDVPSNGNILRAMSIDVTVE